MEILDADIGLSFKKNWNTESRSPQRWITDLFTRVHTTCDVPDNAVFGPCELKHTSVYDSIAFIALKSVDRRTAPYISRVDTSAPKTPSSGLMWLRQVQSARSPEEQNLEAYVKNGQLFFRAIRTIQKEEELLVWYGKDLANLLLLNPLEMQSKGTCHYKCANCNQLFEKEFPFLAHWRFLCTKAQPNNIRRPGLVKLNTHHTNSDSVMALKLGHPENYPHDGKPTTDFHNLARDMENTSSKTSFSGARPACSALKRKRTEVKEDWGTPKTPVVKQELVDIGYLDLSMIPQSSSDSGHLTSNLFTQGFNKDTTNQLKLSLKTSRLQDPSSNVQPGIRPALELGNTKKKISETVSRPTRSEKTSIVTPITATIRHVSVSKNRMISSQTSSSQHLLPHNTSLLDMSKSPVTANTFIYRPVLVKGVFKPIHSLYNPAAHWSGKSGRHLVQGSPSPVLLAPSVPRLSPLRMSAQNWCAKCNVSYRLTSDLVQHMRSHHKRALDTTESGSGMKQDNRERGVLKCSICSEVFRQRHHLARHMNSHTI